MGEVLVFDVIVTGGVVHDGTAAPGFPADIGIAGGRVRAIGRIDPSQAATVIDARGRLVLPGFVDAHSHADAVILDPAVRLALLRQGVTTVVLGQDGLSYAPSTAATLAFVTRYFGAVNGPHQGLDPAGVTVAQLRATWHRRTEVNTAYLIPHGTVRHRVLGGAARPATADELAAMRREVERGLADGAVGLSSGLEYVPGRFGDAAELAELARPVAAAGLPYVTHMRGYGVKAPQGMAEASSIGTASGAAVHVSHYHGPGELLVSMVDDARAAGLDLTFDSYPYRRGCTILAMLALPRWLDDTDLDRVVDRLRDPEVRQRVASGLDAGLLARVTIADAGRRELAAGARTSGWEWTAGRSLTAVAAELGRPVADVLLDLLVDTGLGASAVVEQPPSTDSAAIRALLRHPAQVGGSDGIYVGAHPHPRGWGTFARLLGRHVRELGDWSWSQAAVHLAAHPARRFNLNDRGVLRPGLAADVCLVDPDRVTDRATYAEPRTLAVGVDDVIVNGVPVLRAGELTGALAGQALTPGG